MKQHFLILLMALSLGTMQTTKSMDLCTACHLLQIAVGGTAGAAIGAYIIESCSSRPAKPDQWTQQYLNNNSWGNLQPKIRLAPEYQPRQKTNNSFMSSVSLRALGRTLILAVGAIASYIVVNDGFEGLVSRCN